MKKTPKTPNSTQPDNVSPMFSGEAPGHVCSCFPSHCENYDEHGMCWCKPDVIEIKGSKIFVHRYEQ